MWPCWGVCLYKGEGLIGRHRWRKAYGCHSSVCSLGFGIFILFLPHTASCNWAFLLLPPTLRFPTAFLVSLLCVTHLGYSFLKHKSTVRGKMLIGGEFCPVLHVSTSQAAAHLPTLAGMLGKEVSTDPSSGLERGEE